MSSKDLGLVGISIGDLWLADLGFSSDTIFVWSLRQTLGCKIEKKYFQRIVNKRYFVI